jgi:hypothetical protein
VVRNPDIAKKMTAKGDRAKHLEALSSWLKEQTWKWNQGMEQADDVRGALISVGEAYEELLGSEIEMVSTECEDGTGFELLFHVEHNPKDNSRDTIGPFQFEYVPGATPEQRQRYAEAMKAKRDAEAGQ